VVTEQFNYTSYNGGKSDMLYDLKKDPDENVNIAGNPEYSKTVAKMRALLKTRMAEAAAAKGLDAPE
jgi:hypothetical protein